VNARAVRLTMLDFETDSPAIRKIHVAAADGLGFDHYCGDEDELLIPTWAQAAITDRVILRAAEVRQHEEGKTMLMRDIIRSKDREYKEPIGSWFRAMGRWGGMDDKERSDSILLMSRMGYAGESIF
jgi:hypothetical protein